MASLISQDEIFSIDEIEMASPIGQAAKAGDVEQLRRLISSGASVRIPDDEGWYPLHQAAAAGHIDCLKILLNHEDTDVDWKTSNGETAIYLAARGGHAECLQLLIEANGDFNIQTSKGATALYEATTGGHKQCVACLIEAGADPCLSEDRMLRPVYVAAGRKDRLEILKILLPAAEKEFIFYIRFEILFQNISMVPNHWTTPLYWAIHNNNIEAAKLILDHGIDVNTGHIYSKEFSKMPTLPPLYFACNFRNMEMFRFLLSRGAVLRCEGCYCYVQKVFSSLESDVEHNVNAFRELIDYGFNIGSCSCSTDFFVDFQLFICSNVQLHFYKFLLDCGFKPKLYCCKNYVCNRPYLRRGLILRCICLVVSYAPGDNVCPGSLKHLKESSYWPHIRKFIEKPAPLQHLCRLAVREILRPKGLHRMKEFVSNMDITDIMKSYLLYEDYLTNLILKEEPPQIKE